MQPLNIKAVSSWKSQASTKWALLVCTCCTSCNPGVKALPRPPPPYCHKCYGCPADCQRIGRRLVWAVGMGRPMPNHIKTFSVKILILLIRRGCIFFLPAPSAQRPEGRFSFQTAALQLTEIQRLVQGHFSRVRRLLTHGTCNYSLPVEGQSLYSLHHPAKSKSILCFYKAYEKISDYLFGFK